jgi:hypothetical protein
MNSIYARSRLAHRSILFTPLCLAAWFALMAGAASAVDPAEQGTLMLVRQWDPATGELVGWLPTHSAAMRLTILGDPKPAFDLNEPVTIEWLPRPKLLHNDRKQVLISPEPRVFEGERWVPAKRDGNVVRIAKHLFLIRSIIFGDSQWRRAAQAASSPNGKK